MFRATPLIARQFESRIGNRQFATVPTLNVAMKTRPEGELPFESYPAEHGYPEAAYEPDLGVPARRVLAYSATSAGSPRMAWRLMAEPALWHRWAPHIRGASGLGEPEIEAGRSGFVLFTPGLPVPARITGKRAERW
jgi:hypothetical protein